jgi:hypothetical protein
MGLDLNGNKLLNTSIGPKGEVIRQIATQGLVMHLDAGNKNSYGGSGTTWTDLSGNNINGTLTNSPSFNTSNSGSIVFDGVNDYVSLGSSTIFGITNRVSVFSWINIDSTSGWDGIFGADSNSGGFMHFQIFNGGINTYMYGPNVGYDRLDGVNLTAGTWNQVGLTFGDTTLKIFLNGQQLATTVNGTSNNFSTATDVRIGRVHDDSRFFGGKIANCKVYNRDLSQSEIKQNYNAQKSRFGL